MGIYIFKDLKDEYDKKYDEELKRTGIFWAFSNKQFDDNKPYKNAPDKEYFAIGGGGYAHQSDKEKVKKFFNEIAPKLKSEFIGKVKIEDMIEYELINHECFYTGDYIEVVDIISSYYSELSKKEICNKIKEVYNKIKEKNIEI